MGTSLENLLEDIEALKEHLEYFSVCRGFQKEYELKIAQVVNQLKILAHEIRYQE